MGLNKRLKERYNEDLTGDRLTTYIKRTIAENTQKASGARSQEALWLASKDEAAALPNGGAAPASPRLFQKEADYDISHLAFRRRSSVARAVGFLNESGVQSITRAGKEQFLRNKGLTKEMIAEAFEIFDAQNSMMSQIRRLASDAATDTSDYSNSSIVLLAIL